MTDFLMLVGGALFAMIISGIVNYGKREWIELTDDEINKLWSESHEDGIAMQQGFTTQQHYFAHLILRKAQRK